MTAGYGRGGLGINLLPTQDLGNADERHTRMSHSHDRAMLTKNELLLRDRA